MPGIWCFLGRGNSWHAGEGMLGLASPSRTLFLSVFHVRGGGLLRAAQLVCGMRSTALCWAAWL